MSQAKKRKLFLSLGTFLVIAPSTIATIVSCGHNKTAKPESKKSYQPKNIGYLSFLKQGGMINEKMSQNDYAALKDFSYSLTNKNGKIYKWLPGIIKSSLPKSWATIQDSLAGALKVLITKGTSATEAEVKLVKDFVGRFVSESESAKTNYLIDLIFSAFKSKGFLEYIKTSGGLFGLISKFVTLPKATKLLIDSLEKGITSKNWAKLLEETKQALGEMIIDQVLKQALGLTKGSTSGMIFKIVRDALNKSASVFLDENRDATEKTTSELKTAKNVKDKKETPVFKVLSPYFEKVKTRLDAQKDQDKPLEVPFLRGNGILKAGDPSNSTYQSDLAKNLTFLQIQIQKLLIYFSNIANWNEKDPTLNIDQLADEITDLTQKQKLKKVIANDIKKVLLNRRLWAFAASPNLTKATKFLGRLLNQKLTSISLNGKIVTEFNGFINFILEIFEKPPLTLNLGETKALFKMIVNGLASILNEKEEARSAFITILKTIIPKTKPFASLFGDLIFGKKLKFGF